MASNIFDADHILYLHSWAILTSGQVLTVGFCAVMVSLLKQVIALVPCLVRDYAVISSVAIRLPECVPVFRLLLRFLYSDHLHFVHFGLLSTKSSVKPEEIINVT